MYIMENNEVIQEFYKIFARLRDLSGKAPVPSPWLTIELFIAKGGPPPPLVRPSAPVEPAVAAATSDERLTPLPDNAIQGNWTQSQR